jgi:cation diffusion facilitator CzcD-associated flavoprotein CzcO
MIKKVCVIGAGASGITAVKTLSEKGIEVIAYEKGSKIGGLWRYDNDNGMSSIYKSLHINTSKQMMAYSDYAMPDDYPDYPHHSLIYQYFEDYVNHFNIREKIHCNTQVLQVTKRTDNLYEVTTDKFGTEIFSAVLVCSGHHWSPKYATFPGHYSGKSLHAHAYKSMEGFEGKNILIVGIGNSAVDIACELSNVAAPVSISTRSGAYIVPKYMFGVPTDHISKPPLSFMPLSIQRTILLSALLLNVGKQDNYGIPTPKRPILSEHPTISQELLNKAGHGKVIIKPNIERFDGKKVFFTDGSHAIYDVIIYATGYNIEFPFLDESLVKIKDNVLPLYHKVVHPEHSGLFFIGLIQPLGAIMPLSEVQCKWVANLLNNNSKLPTKSQMYNSIQRDSNDMQSRYFRSSRHTIQVDFYPYIRLLENEMKRK